MTIQDASGDGITERDMQDMHVLVQVSWKACVKGDAEALGKIVAAVYAYKKFKDEPLVLSNRLSEIIAESHSRGNEWIDQG